MFYSGNNASIDRSMIDVNTFDQSVLYFPHQKAKDKYKATTSEKKAMGSSPSYNSGYKPQVLIDFDKLERESTMYNLKVIKVNLLKERTHAPLAHFGQGSNDNILSESILGGNDTNYGYNTAPAQPIPYSGSGRKSMVFNDKTGMNLYKNVLRSSTPTANNFTAGPSNSGLNTGSKSSIGKKNSNL
jgi:hypothetical protein